MVVIKTIGNWHKGAVPSIVSRLAATNQQNRHPTRIKGVENSIGVTLMLDTQLSYVRVSLRFTRKNGSARVSPGCRQVSE
jgi:hypothetical protein